jgi:hypothetical protein
MSKSTPESVPSLLDKLKVAGLKEYEVTLKADNRRKKTNFVFFKGNFLGIDYQFKVPRESLSYILDRIADREAKNAISPGDELMFWLRDVLGRELARATEKKPKGSQARAGLAYFIRRMKWVAPWVYCFLREVCQKRSLDHPLVVSANAELKKKIASKLSPRRHAIYLTAVLVSKAYPDWYSLDLQDPLSDPEDFEPENFYRTYISAHLKEILGKIENKPRLLIPRYNSYLRPVFEPVFGF